MKSFRKKRAKIDPLMAAEWNQMVDIVIGLSKLNVAPPLRLLRSPHGNLLTIAPQASNWFIGKIVDDGPGAPGNYIDQRYWIKEQVIDNGDNDDTSDLTWDDSNRDDALWITATNMAEILSETHFILDDADYRVVVFRNYDVETHGLARYTFYSLGDVELKVTDAHDMLPVPVNQASDPTEIADTGLWDRAAQPADKDGVDVPITTRVVYREDLSKILYGFYRIMTFDAFGRLAALSTETKYIIDDPGSCP